MSFTVLAVGTRNEETRPSLHGLKLLVVDSSNMADGRSHALAVIPIDDHVVAAAVNGGNDAVEVTTGVIAEQLLGRFDLGPQSYPQGLLSLLRSPSIGLSLHGIGLILRLPSTLCQALLQLQVLANLGQDLLPGLGHNTCTAHCRIHAQEALAAGFSAVDNAVDLGLGHVSTEVGTACRQTAFKDLGAKLGLLFRVLAADRRVAWQLFEKSIQSNLPQRWELDTAGLVTEVSEMGARSIRMHDIAKMTSSAAGGVVAGGVVAGGVVAGGVVAGGVDERGHNLSSLQVVVSMIEHRGDTVGRAGDINLADVARFEVGMFAGGEAIVDLEVEEERQSGGEATDTNQVYEVREGR